MDDNRDWNPVEADCRARSYADLIKDGSDGSIGLLRNGLRAEALSMPTAEFLDLLARIDTANARDRAANNLLPDVSVIIDVNDDWRQHSDTTSAVSNVEVSLAKPSKWLGNYWKSSQTIYSSNPPGDTTRSAT